jgi:hypothetical protein
MINRNLTRQQAKTVMAKMLSMKEEFIELYGLNTIYVDWKTSSSKTKKQQTITMFTTMCEQICDEKKPYYFILFPWDRKNKVCIYDKMFAGYIPYDVFIDHETWEPAKGTEGIVILPHYISKFIKKQIINDSESPNKVTDFITDALPGVFDLEKADAIDDLGIIEDDLLALDTGLTSESTVEPTDGIYAEIEARETSKEGTNKLISTFTQREFAAIMLGVPDSGTKWLDDMIKDRRR